MKSFLDYFKVMLTKIKKMKIKKATWISSIIIVALVAFFLMTKDTGGIEAIKWILAVIMLSILTRPILTVHNLKFWDNGFGLSFGMGLACLYMGSWLISVTTHIPFGTGLIYVVFAIIVIAEITHYSYVNHKNEKMFVISQETIEAYIRGCALFMIIFAFAFWVIGFNPAVDCGTENYMDFGFMKAIYRQQMVAPYDIWFSGQKLNYYYMGQAAAVLLCRLAFTTPEYGYNFMLATFWASVFVMVSEIAQAVTKKICISSGDSSKRADRAGFVSGAIGGMMAAFAANGHWLVFGIIKPLLQKLTGHGSEVVSYWFPMPTVYISTELGDIDNGKNEFPSYSAILGDLHAHVINVIFVLPLVVLMLDYAFSDDENKSYRNLILASILLGLYKGSNYWDFAIYFVITGAVVVFCDFYKKGFCRNAFLGIGVKALVVTAISSIIIIPFSHEFDKMASSIMIADNHSPFIKLLVLWGVPFVISIAALVSMYWGRIKNFVFPASSKAGITAVVLCTMGLVITPEVVYMLDIYGMENARFNTMFKLTYQAFVLFGIIIGIVAGLCLEKSHVWFAIIVIVAVLSSAYTPHAISDWMGNTLRADEREGISSIEPLYGNGEFMYEMPARDIIEQDNRRIINIVEAAGDSYTHNSTLSILTGACAPIGWFVHEWMWRNDSYIVSERSEAVRQFYENGSRDYCINFIDDYNINYIFVGPVEYSKYYIDASGFEDLGEVMWESQTTYDRYMLIKVR